MECSLKGKPFYCREWVFSKLLYYLDYRVHSHIAGVLIVGGAGSGKTAVCTEIVWPTVVISPQAELNSRLLAYHFCQYHQADTLSTPGFVVSVISQILNSPLVGHAIQEKLERDVHLAASFLPEHCTRSPDTSFEKMIQLLNVITPPSDCLLFVVDSLHEVGLVKPSLLDLLAKHCAKFPPWLLLVCSARRHWKKVNERFAGFRKLTLDDLRKSSVVRDVQQYILQRIDNDADLRNLLTSETAEYLNLLHIKSNGCILYLEKVLDCVVEGRFVRLQDSHEIPGTLNGLYLWLCQRLFTRKQFGLVSPLLCALLAATKPLSKGDLFELATAAEIALQAAEFDERFLSIAHLLVPVKSSQRTANASLILFHNSFAEWLTDVKHCTQRYLCDRHYGAQLLAVWLSSQVKHSQDERLRHELVLELAYYLSVSRMEHFANELLPLYVLQCGGQCVLDMVLPCGDVFDPGTVKMLIEAGADVDFGKPDILSSENDVIASESWKLTDLSCSGSSSEISGHSSRRESTPNDGESPRTMLLRACREGNQALCVHLCDLLIKENGNENVIDFVDVDGWTPLRAAAWSGHSRLVSILLDMGACVDFTDDTKRSALRAAAWAGHENVVGLLLDAGASPTLADSDGRTPLMVSAVQGYCDITRMLLKSGSLVDHVDSAGRTALMLAVLSCGHVPALACQDHLAVCEILLVEGSANANIADHTQTTPLHLAAADGNVTLCQLLLDHGADCDHPDQSGWSPLLACAAAGHLSCMELLLTTGADVDAIDQQGRTVLSIASAHGNLDVVRYLLSRGLDEMHRDNDGWIPLHFAAYEGHTQVVRAFTTFSSTTVDAVDIDGMHALLFAAEQGHVDTTRALIDAHAAVNRPCLAGRTALRLAALAGKMDVCRLLVLKGADPEGRDLDSRTILHSLVMSTDAALPSIVKREVLEFLVSQGAQIDARDNEQRTPLLLASWLGDVDLTSSLVILGANINAQDGNGRSCLMTAVWQGNLAVIKVLLDAQCDVDLPCSERATPLHVAAQLGKEDVVKLLLQYNADVNKLDRLGRTPSAVAEQQGARGVCRLLQDNEVQATLSGCSAETKTSGYSSTGSPLNTQKALEERTSNTFYGTGVSWKSLQSEELPNSFTQSLMERSLPRSGSRVSRLFNNSTRSASFRTAVMGEHVVPSDRSPSADSRDSSSACGSNSTPQRHRTKIATNPRIRHAVFEEERTSLV